MSHEPAGRRTVLKTTAWAVPTLALAAAAPARAASVSAVLECGRDFELTLDWNQMARVRNLTSRTITLDIAGIWDLAPLFVGFTGDRSGLGLNFADDHDGTVEYGIDGGQSHFRFRKTGTLSAVTTATLAPMRSLMMWSDTMESDGCTPTSEIVLTAGDCTVTYNHWCAPAPF